MRSVRVARLVSPFAHATRAAHGGGPKTRSDVLARWNAAASPAASGASQAASSSSSSAGKGMSFASSVFGRASGQSTRTSSDDSTVGDVKWDLCERMDYYVQYAVPATWSIAEAVRENSVSIQCSPPTTAPGRAGGGSGEEGHGAATTASPSVHGISINCFAYKQRVAHPDSGKLLHIFLKRFNASVGNSLQIVSEHVGQQQQRGPGEPAADAGGESLSAMLATRLNSAVAEITFTPGAGQPLACGLCRAFFSTNSRFHYVVVVAVPEDEYAESQDLIMNTLMSVVESRVEAAAKRT